jgi:hypothetical protein
MASRDSGFPSGPFGLELLTSWGKPTGIGDSKNALISRDVNLLRKMKF